MSSDPQDEFDPDTPMSASPSGLSLAYWETEAGQEELEARIAAWEAEQDRAAEAEALAAQEAEVAAQQEQRHAPVYLAVGEEPERLLKRAAPTLGRVASFPKVAYRRATGAWGERLAALTTASDPQVVLRVGINALLEVRQEQQRATPVAGLERMQGERRLGPVWGHALLAEHTAGILAVLEQEVEGLVEALELVPLVQSGSLLEVLEAARQRAIETALERVGEVVAVLRQRLRRRGAVRQMAALLGRMAWRALACQVAGGFNRQRV